MRRLAALCTALMVLHLTLVGGDRSCATHAGMAGMTRTDASAPDASAPDARAPDAARDVGPAQHSSCPAPSQSRCCDAAAGCAMTLAAAPTSDGARALERVAAITTAVERALPSPRGGPEPPPPKA